MPITKREGGEDFPAQAFAYVPDPQKPSTWKLRLWDSLADKVTAAQVGRAVAALGAGGFRGNRVQLPAADLASVKEKVMRAWMSVHPDSTRNDMPPVLKGVTFYIGTEEDDSEEEDMGSTMSEDMSSEYDDMEDDDMEEDWALSHLVHAYISAIKSGPAYEAVAKKINLLLTDAATVEPAETMPEEYGDDPMYCLIQALLKMTCYPEYADIRVRTIDIIKEVEKVNEAEYENTLSAGSENNDMGVPLVGIPMPVLRGVRLVNDSYLIKSTSGRNFGTFESKEEAVKRFHEIEEFSDRRISKSDSTTLTEWHTRLESAVDKEAGKIVQNLIEDELEARGIAFPYELTTEDKLDMVKSLTGLVAKSEGERKYTMGPVYVPDFEDAHGEFTDADTLQKALWDWVRKGDRNIYLQHSEKKAGEMVEVLTWPFPIDADLSVPNQPVKKYSFPSDTPFMGVVWESWAWDLVKSGELRGYSIGGKAKRLEADLPA